MRRYERRVDSSYDIQSSVHLQRADKQTNFVFVVSAGASYTHGAFIALDVNISYEGDFQ